jgi:hypothetical protein
MERMKHFEAPSHGDKECVIRTILKVVGGAEIAMYIDPTLQKTPIFCLKKGQLGLSAGGRKPKTKAPCRMMVKFDKDPTP